MESLHLRRQFGASWKPIVVILGGASLILMAALFLEFRKGIPIGDLTRDPTSVAGVPLYIGFVSQLGIFAWAATVTACLLAAIVTARQGRERKQRNFFLYAAGLSLVLGMDDVFLLHEVFFPYFHIPELAVFGGYAVLMGVFLLRYTGLMLRTEYLLLVMAFGFLGLSVVTDVGDIELVEPYLLEDGFKLFGVLSWLGYFSRTALAAIAPLAVRQDSSRQASGRVQLVNGRGSRQVPGRAVAAEQAGRGGDRFYVKS